MFLVALSVRRFKPEVGALRFKVLVLIRDLGAPTVPSGFPGRGSPKFPLGWRSAPREFPRVPRGFPDEDKFPEGSPSECFIFVC